MNYYLLHTTYPILFLAVLGRQLCLPVAAELFLLSAGALAGSSSCRTIQPKTVMLMASRM